MKIISLEFKNFASYGNRTQVLELSRDGALFQVIGKNGGGKSTIADVIKFVLYGKNDKKTLKDLPNRINKNLWAKLILTSRGKKIEIERGLEPNLMVLKVNDVLYNKANYAGVNATDYLVDELLELPYYVFNNTSILSINDFKSFLSMSPKDKREIIYKVFGFTIINQMRDLLNKELKKLKESLDLLAGGISSSQQQLDRSHLELEAMTKKVNENSEEELTLNREHLNNFQKLLEVHNVKVSEFTAIDTAFKKEYWDYNSLLSKTKTELDGLRRKLQLYNDSKCPTCSGDLTTAFHNSIKCGLEDDLNKLDERYKEYLAYWNTLKGREVEINADRNSYSDKYSKIRSKIQSITDTIGRLSKKNDSVEQGQYIQNIIDDCITRIDEAKKTRNQNETRMSWMKLVDEALGDRGIKQMAMRTIIPTFNIEIFKMLQQMHLDYTVVFNEEFDAVIKQLGHEISSGTLSFGEVKKVDFVVLVSFIRLMKMKYPSMNLLFLDEVFASLDADGIHSVLQILSEVCKELGLNIFVISQELLPGEMFDYKITAEKKDSFSNMTIEAV